MSGRRIGSILVSGRGSNMAALLRASKEPGYPVRFALVISDQRDAAALGKAAALGIRSRFVPVPAGGTGRRSFEGEVDELLRSVDTDIVCLAGFMRVLSPWFVARWQHQILNVHPSLLPRYPGLDTHARAIENGDCESGCSVHLVTDVVDGGTILGQERVPILPEDTPETLAARVLVTEHRLYPEIVAKFVDAGLPPR